MSLPLLFEAPTDADTWRDWSFNHSVLHTDLIAALQQQKNAIGLQSFLLDPMDLNDLGMWFYRHQVSHNQANAILGTQGYNLLSFDWHDEDQLQEWLFLNGVEHTRFAQVLGVE